VRNPIAACPNDAVERPTTGNQFGTRLGSNNGVNERVDRRISDTCDILRAFGCGCLR